MKPRGVTAVVALAAALSASAACAVATAPGESSGAAPAKPQATTGLADGVVAIGASEALRRSALAQLGRSAIWRDLDARVVALQSDFDALAPRTTSEALAQSDLVDLLETSRRLHDLGDEVRYTEDRLATIVGRLEHDERAVASDHLRWREWIEQVPGQAVPQPIADRAHAIEEELSRTGATLREGRNAALLALDRAVNLRTRIEQADEAVADARERAIARSNALGRLPLWNLAAGPRHFDLVATELREAGRALRVYVVREGGRLGAWFVAILAFAYWLYRRPAPGASPARRAFGHPAAASVLIAAMALWLLAPTPPIYFYVAMMMIAPVPAAMIANRAVAEAIPLTLYGLALATTLLALRDLVPASALVARLLLVLQAASIGMPLFADLRSGRLVRAFPRLSPRLVRGTTRLLFAAAVLVVIGALFGFTGPASAVRDGMGSILGFGLVFGAAAASLYGFALAVLDTPLGRLLRNADAIHALLRAVRFLLGAAAVAGVVTVTVALLGLLPTVQSALAALMSASLVVGTVTVTVTAVAAAVAVVLAAVVVNATVGFVLRQAILPRLRLRQGADYAVATLTRWAIAICGAVLMLAALGIDMEKVTLLAGALGVGIGFGLQNVVNNFVSGLILIVERPMYVGDVIELGTLLGEIRRIDIRSSTVRTMHGAEVIVPNSNLVSREVVNWTRSDRQRRYDIDVGVAYGSEPEQVIRLLEEAAQEAPEVMATPAPLATFVGFGDSSLDFRLLAWVRTIDVGLQAQTGLRIRILRKLEAAGIAIPFPQRDLHVHVAEHPRRAEVAPAGSETRKNPAG